MSLVILILMELTQGNVHTAAYVSHSIHFSAGKFSTVVRNWSENYPTRQSSGRLTAAADFGVGAPSEAWCILQGESPCRVRVSHPPVSSVAPVAESLSEGANRTGEAYTENHIGRRGDRAP